MKKRMKRARHVANGVEKQVNKKEEQKSG